MGTFPCKVTYVGKCVFTKGGGTLGIKEREGVIPNEGLGESLCRVDSR